MSVWLRKKQGGTIVGPYAWPEDGSVTEVDDVTAAALLASPDRQYEAVAAPEPEPAPQQPKPAAAKPAAPGKSGS